MCGQERIAQLWFSGLSLHMKGNSEAVLRENTLALDVCATRPPHSHGLSHLLLNMAALPVLDSCSTKQNQVLLDLLVGFC